MTNDMRAFPWTVALIGAAACFPLGCGSPDGGEAGDGATADLQGTGQGAVVVYTVNYPLAWFTERIGGDLVDVRFPAPGDVDPAFWSPDAETVVSYQSADLVLLNGAGYAAWTDRASLPPSKLIDTSAAVRERYLPVEDAVTHTHGPEGEHSHDEMAFTTWLDQSLALAQAAAIRAALVSLRPAESATFEDGFARLATELEELDARLRGVGGAFLGGPLLVSHPVYQYLSAGYGLDVRSVHFEPDEEPDERAWDQLVAVLRERPSSIMLWEAEPLTGTKDRLAEMGVRVVVFNPAGNRPGSGDYLDVMDANVSRMERAIAPR